MRLAAILLITGLSLINPDASAQRVTLAGKNLTLSKIFDRIQKQSGLSFSTTTNSYARQKKLTSM